MIKKSNKAKEAAHRLARARTSLIIKAPFYGCLALHLKVKCIDEGQINCDTMATDGKHLFYNSDFVLDITEPELIGVVVHEVSHCAYRHMIRMKNHNPVIANIAADFVINKDITTAGFTLPGKPTTLDDILAGKATDKICLLDPQFDNMPYEDAYELVRKKWPELKKQLQNYLEDDQGGKGEGEDNDNSKGGGKRSIPDPGGCGGVTLPAGSYEITKIQEVSDQWETIVRQAVAIAKANNAGDVPANIKRLVGDLERPRIDWKVLLRSFIDDTCKKDYTWLHPNRRHIGDGIYLPGLKSDSVNHLVLAIDTSGSIDDILLTKFASEINAALQEGIAERITVIYADTEVTNVETYQTGDSLILDAEGGGGTDFRDTYKYIKKNIYDASVIIYFTDLYVHEFGEQPDSPILWAVYNREFDFDEASKSVPFGTCLNVV